jgi:hypothetical protein
MEDNVKKYLIMSWRTTQMNYYGLFEVKVDDKKITQILSCLIEPDSKNIFLKNDEDTFYWCWGGNSDCKYYDIRAVVSYLNLNCIFIFSINEFPDDDSAKLWFMLEYGG